MLSLLKLLLPLPLVVTMAASQPPQQPPHRVMPISAGLYRAQQWGHADMLLIADAAHTTYQVHVKTDDGPKDYTLSFYTVPCIPEGAWLTVKQPMLTGSTQPDPSQSVSYNLGSLSPDGELYLFAISRAEDDHGVLAPQLKSGAQGVETIVNAFCGDPTVVLTHGESPTIYHRAS